MGHVLMDALRKQCVQDVSFGSEYPELWLRLGVDINKEIQQYVHQFEQPAEGEPGPEKISTPEELTTRDAVEEDGLESGPKGLEYRLAYEAVQNAEER